MDAMVHGKWSYHVRYGDALGGDLGGYLKLKKKTGNNSNPSSQSQLANLKFTKFAGTRTRSELKLRTTTLITQRTTAST